MNNMKPLRESRGLTMKEAAKEIGLPYTTYVNYEKGTREPSSETLILIADYYGTTVDYLIGKTSCIVEEVETLSPEMDYFSYTMYSASRMLTDDEKELLLDMAARLLKMRKDR